MTDSSPALFTSAATAPAVIQARAVVLLIGGYDGSGNYGDIAQFGAALDLVERLGPGVVALPVLEREYLASHRELVESSGVSAPRALFFDPDGSREDDLLPVGAPADLAFGAVYLYGGGYLNRSWGARKLAMLDAAEALLAAGGADTPSRVASGLQVEAEWVAGDEVSRLGRFDLLGARDSASLVALRGLGPAPAIETGDDAVALLGRMPDGSDADAGGKLRLNLHFAEHDWVSERAGALLDFYAGFLAELGELAGRPVAAQPLIAYLDGRVDERGGVERLRTALAPLGVEVAEPIVLRPAELAEAAPRLRAASLTLSCSYHVALTSLMLAVPAVLIGDNPYYEQKAAGLREDFGLPAAFSAAATADPAASAAEVAAVLLDPVRVGKLEDMLSAGAEQQRRCRSEAEAELLGRLGAAAASALANRLDEQAGRLRRRSAEPAELELRLAAMRTELEELRQTATAPRLETEPRVQPAQDSAAEAQAALAAVVDSRSWRLPAPLRRVNSRLRRLWDLLRKP